MNTCSIYVTSEGDTVENVAEALAMGVFKNISNKEFAIMSVLLSSYGGHDFIDLTYDEFVDKFSNRGTLLEQLLNL